MNNSYTYTLLRSSRILAKKMDIGSCGELIKTSTSAAIIKAEAVVAHHATFEQAIQSLLNMDNKSVPIHGVIRKENAFSVQLDGGVLDEGQWAKGQLVRPRKYAVLDQYSISRSKSDFVYKDGPALLMLDADGIKFDRLPSGYVPPANYPKTPEALVALVRSVEPSLVNAPVYAIPSASAFWFDKKSNKYLSEGSSYRLYFGVSNGSKIPILVANIVNRLAANGICHVETSNNGRFLRRTIFDATTSGCERIDFFANAYTLDKDLIKVVPPNGTYQDNYDKPPADVNFVASDDIAKAGANLVYMSVESEQLLLDHSNKKYADWLDRRTAELDKQGRSIDEIQTYKSAIAVTRSRAAIELHDDHILWLDERNSVSVKELRHNYAKYSGKYILDPIEPEYNQYASVCWVAANKPGQRKCLYSHAHGGSLYFLEPVAIQNGSVNLDLTKFSVMNSPHKITESIYFEKTTENGKPLAVLQNLEAILLHYKIWVEYNKLTRRTIISYNTQGEVDFDEWDNTSLAHVIDCCARQSMDTSRVPAMLQAIGAKHAINPVIDWIRSHPWDSEDRISDLIATIESPMDSGLKHTLIFKWLLYAVRAAQNEGLVNSDGILVMQSKGGVGKGEWYKSLAPAEFNFVRVGCSLKPSKSDSVAQACGFWISELGELDSIFSKNEIGELKAFISNPTDVYRPPYAMRHNTYPRRTAFGASVNDSKFLIDPTGNRKYWVIPVTKINHLHDIDMQQLWHQVLNLSEEKTSDGDILYPHWLTPAERDCLMNNNSDFEQNDVELERLVSTFDWEEKDHKKWIWRTCTSIAVDYFEITNPGRKLVTNIGIALTKLGSDSRKSNGVILRSVPPKKFEIGVGPEQEVSTDCVTNFINNLNQPIDSSNSDANSNDSSTNEVF